MPIIRHVPFFVCFCLAVSLAPLSAQKKVDPRNTYQRLLCVVPMIGSGTKADPRRPEFVPLPKAGPPSRTGIIAFSQQISDDRNFARVEFVAADRSAFKDILADKRATVKVFEKGGNSRAQIETDSVSTRKTLLGIDSGRWCDEDVHRAGSGGSGVLRRGRSGRRHYRQRHFVQL
ncbi:MAG: hypothetical protein M3Z36_02880 [Acidobacteriota bacterium]|nr:hypothetical protein [Acidobacteriota bacterium]